MKTFTDIVESKLGEFFLEMRDKPQLTGYITEGFPVAVASYLSMEMYENNVTETDLVISSDAGKLMRFGLKAVKKGDSIAFVPEFDLLDAGKEYVNSDEVEFDCVTIENSAKEIAANKKFATCLKRAFGGQIYVNGEWIDFNDDKTDKGLVFDEEQDASVCACAVLFSVIEILCNYKDAATELSYPVQGLGTFKIAPVKGGYAVSLTFDKEFKTNCKSDKLAEKIADTIE